MNKAEENYKYALNKDKYDSEVTEAVEKKSLKKKDANTISKIQEMMRKEKEERRKKKSREVVTSKNRDEYMAKKLKLANKQESIYKDMES
jgi:hypothetical protein